MEFKKATKNTFVYAAKDATGIVQSVYLERSVIGATPPKEITVVVRWAE
jgi:hypothetical protein